MEIGIPVGLAREPVVELKEDLQIFRLLARSYSCVPVLYILCATPDHRLAEIRMLETRSRAMHGGRWAIAGFLYQMLGSLGHVARIAELEKARKGDDIRALRITLEPEGGGDAEVLSPKGRMVEQYKSRAGNNPWSATDIVDGVLCDLLRAYEDDGCSNRVRFRFVTNGRVAAEPLRGLLEEIATIGLASDPLQALDDESERFRYRGRDITARAFFREILQAVDKEDNNAVRLWCLLLRFEIDDCRTEAYFAGQIDALLGIVVDHREDISSKRDELVGQLLRRAKTGETVSPVDILKKAGINPDRLKKRSQLLDRLRAQTLRALSMEGYRRPLDVRRAAPVIPQGPLTVLTGESGRGKTWQLLRLAHEYLEREIPCVVLYGISNLDELERALVSILWHESGYDSSPPLTNILERLADILPRPPAPMLTVFIDDVQDRVFADRLLGSNFQQMPVHFILSAQPRIAEALERSPRGNAAIIKVDRFSIHELRVYLSGRQISWTQLPNDVLDLLRQPIMAKLYADTAEEGWSPESEYALLERYWRHVTMERRGQDDHPQDIEPVKDLAFRLFEGQLYPWTQRAARHAGLDDDIQQRLVAVGLLRREGHDIAVSHDRLLNWAVAEAVADRVRDGELGAEALYQLFYSVLRVDAEWREDRIFLRLRYVPMDLLWLLAAKTRTSDLADLIDKLVRGSRLSWDSKTIFEDLLPTLGGRILPALEHFAFHHQSDADYWSLGQQIGRSILLAGKGAPDDLRRLASRLISSEDIVVQRVGLIVAAEISLPDDLDRLWTLHRQYALRRDTTENHDRVLEIYRREHSTAALASGIEGDPGWLRRKLTAVQAEDEIVDLVYLVMKLNRVTGQKIWEQSKEQFFKRLPSGVRCLAQAIRYFRDESCIDWLLEAETEGPDHLAVETRFDALVRLAPEKALELLRRIKSWQELYLTRHGWLRAFIHRLDGCGNSELRRHFAGNDWSGVLDLALVYQGNEDLLDEQSLGLILDALEARLEAHDHLDEWKLAGEGHFLRLLARTRSPRLLRQLEKKKGSRFEQLLVRRAIRNGGRQGLDRHPDAGEYRSLLLNIAGDGIAEVLTHDLRSTSAWTRADALDQVVWHPTEAVRQAVREVAQRNQHEEIEQVFLMRALASLEEDELFADMLRRGMRSYLYALDIRRTKSPIPRTVRDQACADTLSNDERTQLSGIAILSLCNGRKAADCLRNVLASNDPKSAVARAAVWALDDLGHASEETIRLVTPMVQHRDQQRVVFNYLLRRGGKDGEAAMAHYFAAHDRSEITNIEEQVARILVAHGDADGEAAKFLWDVIKQKKSVFGQNENLLALTRSGDSLAGDLLIENSLVERSFTGSPITAIRGLADRDPDYAFEAASRLLEKNPDSGGEDILLKIDPTKAIPFLLDLLAGDIDTLHRWRVCRHLRWLAPRNQLEEEVARRAQDDDARRRELACEVIGWLPPGRPVDSCLHKCVDDVERAVEMAALEALARHQEQNDIRELLSGLGKVKGPARWSRLYALLDLFDPRTLAHHGDPLCIWPVLDKLPIEFTKEAEGVLKRRVDREKQAAKKVDQNRRRN